MMDFAILSAISITDEFETSKVRNNVRKAQEDDSLMFVVLGQSLWKTLPVVGEVQVPETETTEVHAVNTCAQLARV